MLCSGVKRFGTIVALAAMADQAFASDFYALTVLLVVIGISGALVAQALIGIVMVIRGRYASKNPTLFIGVAVTLLLIGTWVVLDEAAHMASEDLVIVFSAMFGSAAIAILPPLIQRVRSKR